MELFAPCSWLALLVEENEFDEDVDGVFLGDLSVAPDRRDDSNSDIGVLYKWEVSGYSLNQIQSLMSKIESKLSKVSGLKYQFYCE